MTNKITLLLVYDTDIGGTGGGVKSSDLCRTIAPKATTSYHGHFNLEAMSNSFKQLMRYLIIQLYRRYKAGKLMWVRGSIAIAHGQPYHSDFFGLQLHSFKEKLY